MTKNWHSDCQTLLKSARDAVVWINDPENDSIVGLEKRGHDRRLRRLVTEATKLDNSVDKPMCVGIFGPSQAGKSYLVSMLAREKAEKGKEAKPLMARFDGLDEPVDFLTDINPDGERESTGIVTRFTLSQKTSPEGFPVAVRLLSEIDLLKVLGNTYFLDSDVKTIVSPTSEEISDVLALARSRQRNSKYEDNLLTNEDIWDLQEYFERAFEGKPSIDILRGYWDEAANIAPNLSIEHRAELFSVLWGRLAPFTGLYSKLTNALKKLGFAADAFCKMDALLPKTKSIIDVMTLTGIDGTDESSLEIRSNNSAIMELTRSEVTALTAELHLTIDRKPWPFFADTDLLDFPGARGRQPLNLETFLEDSSANPLKELLLRGKVAYLFDRYVAEQELTSMLLCVRPSNQDVTDLPDMINHWVSQSHGQTPAQRAGKTVVLFLILTWFDVHIKERAGLKNSSPDERFKSRVHTSIESYFAKGYDWPNNWENGKPFNNTYWLRNPYAEKVDVFEYNGDQEIALKESEKEYVQRLREGCISVPGIQKHFKEPGRAFDEAMKLNDGGVSYLAENLEPVCNPALKDEQIAGRISVLKAQLSDIVSPFYVSNDVEVRLQERRLVSQGILAHIQRLGSEGRFADLLTALQTSQQTYSSVLREAYSNRALDQNSNGSAGKTDAKQAPVVPAVPMPGLPPLPGMAAPASVTSPTKENQLKPPTGPHDVISSRLARAAIEHWLNLLHTSAEAPALSRFFQGDTKLAMELVNELSVAARRKALESDIYDMIVDLSGSVTEEMDMYMEKAAFASAAIVNRFVNRFYFETLDVAERPQAPTSDGTFRQVFTRADAANSASEIDLSPSTHKYDALADWMYAFHTLVEDNAKSIDGQSINIDQNEKLGGILNALREIQIEA